MNQELSNVLTWLSANKLSLNVKKTHFMVFKTKKKKALNNKSITIDGKEIEKVKFTKFLGLVIDEELTWKYHINQVSSKISKMTGIIAKARHYVSLDSLIMIYNTMIYPSITIDGKEIEKVKFTKFLGLVIDEELTWKYHINQVSSKISKMTGIIAKARHYVSLDSLIMIYNTMIYPSITIDGKEIEKVKFTKFLGLVIDEELTWKYHINQVSSKISKMTGIIAKARHYVSLDSLIMIYNTMIYPFLIYCNITWTSTYPTRLQPIYLIQKNIVRIMTFAIFTEKSKPIFQSLKLMNIYQLNTYLTALFMFS